MMHILAGTAKDVKPKEEKQLVELIETACESYLPNRFPLFFLEPETYSQTQGASSPSWTASRSGRPNSALSSPPPPAVSTVL